MNGNVRFKEHQIISELRMRKEYRIADMVEGAFRYYRWQMKGLRDKVDYIHEQNEVIKDYKHRAEVAEKALLLSCDYMSKMYAIVFLATNTVIANKQELYDYYIKQAEKDLSELSNEHI